MFLRCYLISPYSVTPWLGGPSLYTPTLWSLDAVTKSNKKSRKETAYSQEPNDNKNTHASRGQIFAHSSILAPYLFLSFTFLEKRSDPRKEVAAREIFWDSILMTSINRMLLLVVTQRWILARKSWPIKTVHGSLSSYAIGNEYFLAKTLLVLFLYAVTWLPLPGWCGCAHA